MTSSPSQVPNDALPPTPPASHEPEKLVLFGATNFQKNWGGIAPTWAGYLVIFVIFFLVQSLFWRVISAISTGIPAYLPGPKNVGQLLDEYWLFLIPVWIVCSFLSGGIALVAGWFTNPYMDPFGVLIASLAPLGLVTVYSLFAYGLVVVIPLAIALIATGWVVFKIIDEIS